MFPCVTIKIPKTFFISKEKTTEDKCEVFVKEKLWPCPLSQYESAKANIKRLKYEEVFKSLTAFEFIENYFLKVEQN